MTVTAQAGVSLEASRLYCARLTRSAARNFYYGLRLLPEPKRSAMFAIYAYMRLIDDVADDDEAALTRPVEQRLAELEAWKQKTRAALAGQIPDDHPVWPALAAAARDHGLPGYVFDDAIAGQCQDLRGERFATFQHLEQYCYRVAGVVGLASIHVWGFTGGAATEAMAVDRGVAFQLTNILRDLREDAKRGRCYLPADELAAMQVRPEELGDGTGGERFVGMMQFQVERAKSYYERSAALETFIDADSRPTLAAMTEIYRRLLDKIAIDPQRALHGRVSLSILSKLRIGWRAARARPAR